MKRLFENCYELDDIFVYVCEGVKDKRVDRAIKYLKANLSEDDIHELRGRLDAADAAQAERMKGFDDAKRLVYHWKDEFPSPQNKFIEGVVRIQLQEIGNRNVEQFEVAAKTARFQQSLKLLCGAHLDEYDENLNGLSMEQINTKFKSEASQNTVADRDEHSRMQFSGASRYQIVKITSFEEASKYGNYTSWCITHYRNMWDSYSQDGFCPFYFCLRDDWQTVKQLPGENQPLDDYGLSMLAVCVNMDGSLKTCTCRWNHDNGGNDQILNSRQISGVINRNFYDVFKPLAKEEIQNVLVKNGYEYVKNNKAESLGIFQYSKDNVTKYFNSDWESAYVVYDLNDVFCGDVFCVVEDGHFRWAGGVVPKFIEGPFTCNNCISLTSLEGAPQNVGGDFVCTYCTSLASLKGAPQSVGREFCCARCTSLTSLEGAPQNVGGDFVCTYCTSLASLKGAPQNVMSFDCSHCDSLTNLEGAPQIVGLGFYCNSCKSLTSLSGAPQSIPEHFCCSWCKSLTSLEGAPQIVGGDFCCDGCKSLTSLKGAPRRLSGGEFDCSDCTSLTSLKGAPQKVRQDFICNNCTSLTSLKGAPQEVDGSFRCIGCELLTSFEGAPIPGSGQFFYDRCPNLTYNLYSAYVLKLKGGNRT